MTARISGLEGGMAEALLMLRRLGEIRK